MLIKLVSLLSLFIFLLSSSVWADRRSYVWTYEYMITHKGELELENYLDFEAPNWNDKSTSSWTNQIELEYGITKSWDIALYQVFSQANSGSYKFNQMKLRTRYRLFEAGRYPINPLIYLEYKRPSNPSAPSALEGKLVLAKDIEQLNLSSNIILEKELSSGSDWETEYTVGGSYHFLSAFKAGAELIGNFESGNKNFINLGPTVSLADEKFFMTVGVLWGLSRQSDDFRFRYILGFEL